MSQPAGGGGLWNLSTLIGEPAETPPETPPPAGPAVVAPAPPMFPPPTSSGPMPPGPMPPGPMPPGPVPSSSAAVPSPPAAPSSARTNRTIVMVIGVLVLVASLAVGTAAALSRTSSPAGGTNAAPPVAVQQAPTDSPTTAAPPTEAPTTEAAPTLDAQAAALVELRRLHDQDAVTVRFNGQYVAQLASKNAGIVDNYQTATNGTHTFQPTDILAEHMALRQADNRGATVVLVLSTDYGKRQLYNGAALWITMALGPFGSAGDVNVWCAQRFPALSGAALQDQCTPRRPVAAGA